MEFLLSPKFYLPILYICGGILLNGIVHRIIARFFQAKQSAILKNSHNYKKTSTVVTLIQSIIRYVIAIIVILLILSVYGVDVTSIIAGLGIVGAVAGLAFQDTLKDFLAGIFIIVENQYTVGDTVEIGGFTGEVTYLGLKTTRIKDYKGAVKILANHYITEVINYSMNDSLAIVEVQVSYEDDLNKIEKTLCKIATEQRDQIPNITGDIEVQGITSLDASGIIYRVTAPTKSMEQYGVERALRKEIKLAFDKANIRIPYPQVEVHNE